MWVLVTYLNYVWHIVFIRTFFLIYVVTSHHLMEPLVISVSDSSWLCPWVSNPGLMRHCFLLSLAHSAPRNSGLGLAPMSHLGMVRLPLESPPNVTSRTARGRFKPSTSWPKPDPLPTELSPPLFGVHQDVSPLWFTSKYLTIHAYDILYNFNRYLNIAQLLEIACYLLGFICHVKYPWFYCYRKYAFCHNLILQNFSVDWS